MLILFILSTAGHDKYITDYGDGPDFNVADFYSVTTLDSLIATLQQMQAAATPTTKYARTRVGDSFMMTWALISGTKHIDVVY